MGFLRILRVSAALCLVSAACGSVSDTVDVTAVTEDLSGDGVLDCEAGFDARSVGVEVFGATERDVVEEALAEWTSNDADIVELPTSESWAATLNGRDVAIALPEQNGTGEWVVQDLQKCGALSVGAAPMDGQLDCEDDYSWSEQGSFLPDTVGAASAREAVEVALADFVGRKNGVLVVTDATGSIVVDGREQVVASAGKAPAGGWIVGTTIGCRGFER